MKDPKELVIERYGKIAEQNPGEKSSCCATSCCGSGSDLTTFSVVMKTGKVTIPKLI